MCAHRRFNQPAPIVALVSRFDQRAMVLGAHQCGVHGSSGASYNLLTTMNIFTQYDVKSQQIISTIVLAAHAYPKLTAPPAV